MFLYIFVYRFSICIEIPYIFCILGHIEFVAGVSQMVIFYSKLSQPSRKVKVCYYGKKCKSK